MSVFETENIISRIFIYFNFAMTRTFTSHLTYQRNKAFYNELLWNYKHCFKGYQSHIFAMSRNTHTL